MPYPFHLPTTSSLSLITYFDCSSHPSLLHATSSHRDVVRNLLKKHKCLPPQCKDLDLSGICCAVENYIPYLFALDSGLKCQPMNEEDIDVVLLNEPEVEWRTTLGATIPGREPPRVKGKGLDYEICFVLSTLAYLHVLLAQSELGMLYGSSIPTVQERTGIISKATKHLLQANSVHAFLASRLNDAGISPFAVEQAPSTQGALAEIAMAEATLLAVLKDDPYPAVVAQNRNEDDSEWKFKAPEIPKVRAHLGARLCLAAAEHSVKAESMLLAVGKTRQAAVDDSLIRHVQNLGRTARAKAYRLFGINAEMEGEVGKGIAWLTAAGKELGFEGKGGVGSKLKGIAKLKKEWAERKEDKNIKRGGDWGIDASRFEEARIIEMLESKWVKMNDIVKMVGFCFLRNFLIMVSGKYPNDTTIKYTFSECALWKRHLHHDAICSLKFM